MTTQRVFEQIAHTVRVIVVGGNRSDTVITAPRGEGAGAGGRIPKRTVGRGHDRIVAISRRKRFIHPVQLGEISVGSGTGPAGEIEIHVKVEPRRVDTAKVFAIEIPHPRVVGRCVEDIAVGCAAAVEVRTALVSEQLNRPAEGRCARVGQGAVDRHLLHRVVDGRAGVGKHLVDRRGRRVGIALRPRRAEVGRDGDGIKRALHGIEDACRHPIVRGEATRHAHDTLVLTGEDLAPNVHVALGLATRDLPLRESRVFGKLHLREHPLRRFESVGGIPDFIGPLGVGFAPGLEVIAHIDGEVAHEVIIGHVRHIEPRVGIQIVGQLHHVFDRHSVGQRLAPRPARAGTLPDVERVAAIRPRADVCRVRLLRHHEADDTERREPRTKKRVERRERRAGLPALSGK